MIPALANHLWQSTLAVAVAGLLTLTLKMTQARVRHWVWLIASVKFLVPFSVLIAIGTHLTWWNSRATQQPRLSLVIEEVTQPFARSYLPNVSGEPASTALPAAPYAIPAVLAILWFSGCMVIGCSWCARWRRIRADFRSAIFIREGREFEALLRLQEIGGMRNQIPLAFSHHALEPGAFGIFHPTLLMPAGIVDRLTDAQLEATLAHEFCHIHRHDNLAAAIHMVVEAIFWFHPVVWWLGARLVEERERACDEEVLHMGTEPETYADSILKACKFYLESPLPCMSGITSANLKQRIERIMTYSFANHLSLTRKLLLATVGIAAIAGPISFGLLHPPPISAQSPPAPRAEFEVASIKPHPPGPGPLSVERVAENGRIHYVNVAMKGIIRAAYGLQPNQISEAPAWFTSDRYDIEAKAAGRATEEQMMPMLRTLLEERFKMTAHRETKDLPIYNLVVAKSGIRIHEVKDDDGGAEVDGDEHSITFRNAPMALLAEFLSHRQLTDRPVFDQTGIKGVFNFTLKYSPDDPSAELPDIFGALQDQLGLKLVPGQGAVEILVIDHVEKPTAN